MRSPKRSLFIGVGVTLCLALVIVFIVPRSSQPVGKKKPMHDRTLEQGTDAPDVSREGQGERRVRLPARPTADKAVSAENDPEELWQILEDDEADDLSKESAALKLAAGGDPEAVARLWHLWQAGKLPSSCSWVCDMVSKETAATEGETEDGKSKDETMLTSEQIAEAIAVVMNPEAAETDRLKALRQLGAAGTVDALAALETVVMGRGEADDKLRVAAFEALAGVDPSHAAKVLSSVLSQQAVDAELLVAFLEALGDEPADGATDVALPLLSHASSEVREEAAWVLSVNAADHPVSREVLEALRSEADPAVRARLFEALGADASEYAETILTLVQKEEAPSVRIKGYQALAQMASANPSGQAGRLFDANAVPELSENALTAPEYSIRFGSFVALRTARTSGAAEAIRRLAAEAGDRRIADAAAAATE